MEKKYEDTRYNIKKFLIGGISGSLAKIAIAPVE